MSIVEIGKETFPARELKTGHVTVGLVPVRLTDLGDFLTLKGVTIRADIGNTATVFVGAAGVSTDTGKRVGYPVTPGESIVIPADSPYHLWAVSTDDEQQVFWMSG
jgi:hypothetical protein